MSTNLRYSYEFGQEVVERFTEKYARATDFVAKMLGISHEDLCKRMIYQVRSANQLKWEATKRVIKLADREEFASYRRMPVKDRRKYLTYVYENAIDEELDEKIAQEALDGQSELFDNLGGHG